MEPALVHRVGRQSRRSYAINALLTVSLVGSLSLSVSRSLNRRLVLAVNQLLSLRSRATVPFFVVVASCSNEKL